MFYESQLQFVKSFLKRLHIPINIVDVSDGDLSSLDTTGIADILMFDSNEKGINNFFRECLPNRIYRVKNFLFCTYIYLLLPDTDNRKILLIGPYTNLDITHQMVLEKGELMGLDPKETKQLSLTLSQVPKLREEIYLYSLLDTLGEVIWGNDSYSLVNTDREDPFEHRIYSNIGENNPEDTLEKMKILEQRYSLENKLIEAISCGQVGKVEMLLPNFSQLSFERRLSDQLRNIKNYCIITNTLLRKAAENGGVHPIYIDGLSSKHAKQIELLPTVKDATEYITEIFESYCTLVRRKSMRHYSPLVERAIACIDGDLTADLSLRQLSAINGVSESYFSTLFKKETGKSLTKYVTGKRIAYAKHLLKTTNLLVQTVAQHCGIYDIHYFSKMFKSSTGKTPKQYRDKK